MKTLLATSVLVLALAAPLAASPARDVATPVPLTASTTTAQSVNVVSFFGNLGQPHERFADVLTETTGRFEVVTPPGMATNGGIALAAVGGRLTAALLPSQLLHFTPLATSTVAHSWKPGLITTEVAHHPNAIARSGGLTAAVDIQGVLRTSMDLVHWKKVSVALSPWSMAAHCRAVAVTFAPRSSVPEVGLMCKNQTRSLLVHARSVGQTSMAKRQLLRLQGFDTGIVSVSALDGRGVEILRQGTNQSTIVTAAIDQVQASAIDQHGTVALLGLSRGHEVVVTISGSLVTFHRAPLHARAVALTRSGATEVLCVIDHPRTESASLVTLRTWRGNWVPTGAFGVPVPYGSSK